MSCGLMMKNKTFIIAEIGVNANGNIETAKRLIEFAKWAGADAVKFQMWAKVTFPKLEDLRFWTHEMRELFEYCNQVDIEWFCTPFDVQSVEFLVGEGMTIWKIPSNRIVLDNAEMLEAIAKIENKKRLIISTGAFDVKRGTLKFYTQIESLLQKISTYPINNSTISILHCISKYPTDPLDANLSKITQMLNWLSLYGCNIGLSDHSETISIPIAAVALGATVIEKHITLDRNSEGFDHRASIEPNEFKQMVSCIREVEKAIQ